MSALIPIGAAIAGAIAAAFVAQYLRRARPIIIIDEISRSPDAPPRPSTAVPDLELAAACQESGFISELPDQQDKRITEAEYVTWVHTALEQAESAMDGLPALHRTAVKLNECLQRDDFDDFGETFSRELFRVWPSILGGYRKGEISLQGPPPVPLNESPAASPTTDGDQEFWIADTLDKFPEVRSEIVPDAKVIVFSHPDWEKQIVQDKEGELLIAQSGPRNLIFPWTLASPSQQPGAKAFAMRIAVSFAATNVVDLQQLANFLLKVEQRDRPQLESLSARLESELRKYERVVIKGNIANRGGSPVTVTAAGRLFVGMAGYSFADDTRTLKSHPTDEEIEMVVGAERPEGEPLFDSPITVDAGDVTRFVATSATRIQDLRYAEILLGAMTSGERKAYLGTMLVSPQRRILRRSRSRSQFTPTYTDPQPFRDSAAEVRVPARPQGGLLGLLSRMRARRTH
jgi:hypothetical protein